MQLSPRQVERLRLHGRWSGNAQHVHDGAAIRRIERTATAHCDVGTMTRQQP